MAKKKKKSNNASLIIIGVLIIVLSMVLGSYLTSKDINLKTDENAIKENDPDEEKMEVSPGGGAVSLEYSNQVSIKKEQKEISMYLKNPSKSREHISIEIYAKINGEEVMVAESKIIPTGYSINKLSLKEVELQEGKYQGYIKVFFYNENTNQKEIVDSKINIDINVK